MTDVFERLRAHGVGSGKKLVGNAQPGDVRSGKTFSNSDGNDKVGTLSAGSAAPLTITPGVSARILNPGIYDGTVTVEGDLDLATGNIKAGANIFGVAGKAEVVDTTEVIAPVAAANILSGKKAFVNGTLVSGTMANKVGSATIITPGTADQAIPAGYYGGTVGDGKVAGDSDLVAGNIKSGVNIFGVAGNVIAGIRIKTLQRGSYSWPEEAVYEKDVPVTTVDMSKAILVCSARSTLETDSLQYTAIYSRLTANNNIRFYRSYRYLDLIIEWEVIEFEGPINVQHVWVSGTNVTYQDYPITAVDLTKTFLISHLYKNGGNTTYGLAHRWPSAKLQSTTSVRAQVGNGPSSASLFGGVQVVSITA